MAEILKEWLTDRLQRPIKWEAQGFGEMMRNGHIVASVLHSYHVINDEKMFLIRHGNDMADIKNNWKYLTEWLREVEVYPTDTELNNIMEGKGSALLRLFYQLFLHMDKRDRTNFIKEELKMVSDLVEKFGNRFNVDKVKEEKEPRVEYLSKPLLNEKQFIEWQIKKSAQIKETYDFVKHKYGKTLEKIKEKEFPCATSTQPRKKQKLNAKDKAEMERFSLKYPCKYENYTYEQLMAMDELKPLITDSEWTKNYMEDLYTRMKKRSDSEEFQREVRTVLSNQLWAANLGEEETKVDMDLAKKTMKLSQFEKQMCTQIMETKQQARNLTKNRIEAEKQFSEQRDMQFNQYLENLKDQIRLEVVEIDYEKKRQNMLHNKLYGEKMKRKRQHYYELCYDTVIALVDYATKYAYFKRLLEDEIPEHFIHEWKNLFFRMQPIFDIIYPMEELLTEPALEEEVEPEDEEVKRLELERQEALSDSEFKEYHNYLYPWNLELLIPNYDPESEERKYEYLGNRILGHLVYTLLKIKYPYPPPMPPAALPPFQVKALVRGLPDKSITAAMQILLQYQKIFITRLESAINFCLRQYKREMIGSADIVIPYDKFINNAEEDRKEFMRGLKSDEEVHSKSSDNSVAAMLGTIPANCKLTQTPKTLPEEDMSLTTAAELGKYTYEALSFGDSLTDHLIAAMLVEYLKVQQDINGFVIINYPNSYREAQILEETFSGREPPNTSDIEDKDDIYLEECIIKHRKKEKDDFKDIRVSKLVTDPHKSKSEQPFESYFTCYLKLKETDDILQEYFIWDLNEDNSELIDRFYAILGMNYSLYYEVMDKELLAQMCRYIIGDYTFPLKPTDSIFGMGVMDSLDFPFNDDKRTKSRMIKPEVSLMKSKDKLRRASRASKSDTNQDVEVVKPPSLEELNSERNVEEIIPEEEVAVESKATTTSEEVKIQAGEEDWDYGELPIIESIGISLATCWEEIEKAYIHDIEQMFFSKRLQMNCVVPYSRFIRDKMYQIITLPSNKQDFVSKFQKSYNDFEDDWRDVNLTKNEWHCRIKELQTKLYHICDDRKLFAQQQRQALIIDNWVAEELTTLANTFISLMQAELNRSVLTFQALHDFYFAMIRKMPDTDRLTSKELIKINKEIDESGSVKKGVEDKVYRHLKQAFQDLLLKGTRIDFSNNPLNLIMDNNLKYAMKVVKDINDHYRTVIAREYSDVAKIVPVVKKKDDLESEEVANSEETFKQNALKCIDEWIMGINGEMYRANLRFLVLLHKCYAETKLFNDTIFNAFDSVQEDINNYYANEIKAVDRLCKYLQMAVENGKKIPETLELIHDIFVINPNLLQFPTAEPKPEPELTELVEPTEFKFNQLSRLRSQLKLIAPTGIALQQGFIYVLQDFVFFGKESCEGSLFPDLWKRIDPEKIPKLVYMIFGETAYIDWREFLIYCLNIRPPTIDELLDMRHAFRCVDRDSTELIDRKDFNNHELWFEKDFDPENKYAQLRKALVKEFLFELYECAENKMNYSAFLIAFCKHINPIEGFASAIAMAVGKRVCFSFEECDEIICKFIKQKQLKDESLARAHETVSEILESILTEVINDCEGTRISEIEYVQPAKETSKKSKKGKHQKKQLQQSTDNSVMNVKPTKKDERSRSKLSQMASNENYTGNETKKTFICRPCEDLAVEEKAEEKTVENVEEEKSEEILPDPSIAYAVSKDVIWNVLRVCLPWHFVLLPEQKTTPYEEMVAQVLARLEVHHDDGDIYLAMFVSDENIQKLLYKVNKFKAVSLVDAVRKNSF